MRARCARTRSAHARHAHPSVIHVSSTGMPSSSSASEDEERSRKKHKKHHHKHKKEKHKKEKHKKKHRHHSSRGEDVDDPAAPASAAFGSFVAANPSSRSELRMLLEMLDAGQVVVLDQLEDAGSRTRLQAALEALGMPSEVLPDGSRAHAKPDGSTFSLAAQFASILDEPSTVETGGGVQGSMPPTAGSSSCEAPAAAAARRVYGVAAPPPTRTEAAASIGPAMPTEGIGPAMPPQPPQPEQGDDDDDDDRIGPALPTSDAAAVEEGIGKRLWWQGEQSMPKPAAAIEEVSATAAPTERDGWMVSLPTERTDRNTQGQARQFSRNGVQEVGDLSIWTDTPAEIERKAKAAEARTWGAAAVPAGGGGGGDGAALTLAEAVALARQNAASGKRPRGFETKRVGESGGGGEAESGVPKAKSLVELRAEQLANEKKEKKGKAGWEGQHPWKPWDRETDLDIRAAKPKAKESMLNDQFMGTLKDRFGGGTRETTFM